MGANIDYMLIVKYLPWVEDIGIRGYTYLGLIKGFVGLTIERMETLSDEICVSIFCWNVIKLQVFFFSLYNQPNELLYILLFFVDSLAPISTVSLVVEYVLQWSFSYGKNCSMNPPLFFFSMYPQLCFRLNTMLILAMEKNVQ